MDQTHHVIDYIELNVVDLAASRAFYEQAFGWEFNDYGPDYAGMKQDCAMLREMRF
ncbi:VOC family protein [Nocardioides sp.]|uniref:VOC family protein n=1 Tax=Nocardioides sp. TaxID=35761 RepID=UPI00286DE713|nr:VOC family protein [Nocardioides sp.]